MYLGHVLIKMSYQNGRKFFFKLINNRILFFYEKMTTGINVFFIPQETLVCYKFNLF